MTAFDIVVRDIDGQSEMRAVEELQKEVWGVPDLDVVPLTQLVAAKASGGILLGAFDKKILIGFAYGFAGFEHGRTTHHSHMLAVKPAYRSHSIGYRLKLAQRDFVRAQGIEEMTWTFDPLQSLNAYFNFNRLGVVSDRYLVNFYGEDAASFLHQTGTDRLWVTWDLANCHREKQIEKENFGQITPLVKVGIGEFPISDDLDEGLKADQALIEIPSNINDLVEQSSELAKQWREATRLAFTEAIRKGFLVKDFQRISRGQQHHGVYLLERNK